MKEKETYQSLINYDNNKKKIIKANKLIKGFQ